MGCKEQPVIVVFEDDLAHINLIKGRTYLGSSRHQEEVCLAAFESIAQGSSSPSVDLIDFDLCSVDQKTDSIKFLSSHSSMKRSPAVIVTSIQVNFGVPQSLQDFHRPCLRSDIGSNNTRYLFLISSFSFA